MIAFEALESRRLLTTTADWAAWFGVPYKPPVPANPTAFLNGAVLAVEGTNSADVIALDYVTTPGLLAVRSKGLVIGWFSDDTVGQIEVTLNNGPDTLLVFGETRDAMNVDGGSGDDFINTGDGDDEVTCGGGDDVVFAFGGTDHIEGNGGIDALHGGADDDDLLGGGGNDILSGDDGDDELRGEGGNDLLLGGDGDDFLSGGNGTDQAFGNDGFNSADASNEFLSL